MAKQESQLLEMVCRTCGVRFGFPEPLFLSIVSEGNSFFCPSGHEIAGTAPPYIELSLENSALKKRIKQLAYELDQAIRERLYLEKPARKARCRRAATTNGVAKVKPGRSRDA